MPQHRPVHAPNLPKPVGPYSPGMGFERLVFVSGQGGVDPATGLIAPDTEAQTEQVLKNIQTIQEAAGSNAGAYTDGPIGRAILLLAIPMVLELVLESVFAVVDVFFVSRLGPDSVATVGVTESMLTIVYAVAIGLSAGATATVARRIGERDRDGAALAAVQAIALGIAVAAPIGLFGAYLAGPLLAAMGAGSDVVAPASYTRIVLGMTGIVLLLFLINAVFGGVG